MVDNTQEVLNRLGQSLSLLQDAETGQRGYLLTADTAFLAPLRRARRAIPANHQALVQLTADNAEQQLRLDTLRQLTARRLDIVAGNLAYFGRARAVDVAQLRQGKAAMDQARAVLARLAAAERHLLAGHRAHSQRSAQRALVLIGARTGLALLLSGLVIGLLHRTRQVRQAVQADADARASEAKESRARFRQLLESIPNMVWTAQPNGLLDYYNQQWYDYTGLSFADLAGINWQHHIHPDDFAATITAWQHAVATGEPLTTLRNRWKRAANGEYRWHLVRAVPLRDEATGAARLWVGTNTDIHAQQLQQQELERVNADLDTFVYTASHDLKTPIYNIEALLGALREELAAWPAPADVATLLALMQGAVDRFKDTIEQLTDVAKLQHQAEPPTAAIDLAALVEHVRQDLQPLFAATGGRLHLDVAACPRLVFAEKNLRSVVYNLLSNALKYRHPDRVPAVWLRTYPAPADGSRSAVLEVEDNGLGLALGPEQQRKLFGLFERLHDHVEGSGLGLFMVKKIVENAGGHIEVNSQLGQGTVFRLHLPAPQPVLREKA
ncbi:sensor histidine kinase [Hymenobacter coccineus]|uniref:histidine kinase n=1 Tax=Hymenobacter coccineus TaxID=1908235 RepID=A0A1G1TK24_9BACT|nr:CHASE3 domain-containing protein [Hymenobacter coccineus]OGX91231.1 hypothetical protein BEN49_05330 [Hymenobacter coccineus]